MINILDITISYVGTKLSQSIYNSQNLKNIKCLHLRKWGLVLHQTQREMCGWTSHTINIYFIYLFFNCYTSVFTSCSFKLSTISLNSASLRATIPQLLLDPILKTINSTFLLKGNKPFYIKKKCYSRNNTNLHTSWHRHLLKGF